MKVRNAQPFALLLKAGTSVLAQRQYAQSGPEENKWHEHPLRYTSVSSVPVGQPADRAGRRHAAQPTRRRGHDQIGEGDGAGESSNASDRVIDAPAETDAVAVTGPETEDEPIDGEGYVRFDDVRLTKSPALPRRRGGCAGTFSTPDLCASPAK